MFERILRAWDIIKEGGAVLVRHPKLLILPAISMLAVLGIVTSVVIAGGDDLSSMLKSKDLLVWVVLFFFYFVLYFIILLFNAALLSCVLEAFAGRVPSICQGFVFATGRLPQILMWAFIATSVGLVLNAAQSFLKSSLGRAGSMAGDATEFAWTVATYFVLPLVVVEGAGPLAAIKRSGTILKGTWGETVVGEFGLSLFTIVALVPAMLVAVVSIAVGQRMGADWPTFVGILGIAAPYTMVVLIIVTGVTVVFQAGVYVYATTGQSPGKMDSMLVSGAFRRRYY